MTLAELLELCWKATPGPFSIERRDDDCGYMNHIVHGAKGDYAWCRDELDPAAKRNAEFIAAASPAVVKALVEAVQAAQSCRPLLELWEYDRAKADVERFDSAMASLTDAMKGDR